MKLLIKIILPLCFISAGLAGWNYFKSKEPVIKRKPLKQQSAVVKAFVVKKGDHQTWIHAMGTVLPDREVVLKSKLTGEVISVSKRFVQGGVVKKGELLLNLDDSDYKIEVQKAKSALDKAIADLLIEKGAQLIAKEEFKLIKKASSGEIMATDLSLRKPQLMQAKAGVDNARADLEKAELNLSRTKVFTPFNALILEKHVDKGSLVTAQEAVASLVDVNTYKIEALVPQDRLSLFGRDEISKADAYISLNYSNHPWQGSVFGITGKITPESRMAGVTILVPDPLGLKNTKARSQLLLDDHVTVKIRGPVLENVFSIPRSAIREQNRVWVYNSGVLEIIKIEPVWKEKESVYVKQGIKNGDRVITSDLPVAVAGMILQMEPGEGS